MVGPLQTGLVTAGRAMGADSSRGAANGYLMVATKSSNWTSPAPGYTMKAKQTDAIGLPFRLHPHFICFHWPSPTKGCSPRTRAPWLVRVAILRPSP